jgi:glycerophosphoryl diester phosphodiesterase
MTASFGGSGAPVHTRRLAHRGDWRHAPENSVEAMRAALAVAGCDGLEFDVRRSADGIPVLLHDATLERVQGRPERVDAMTAEALEGLGIPSLADVLAAVGRRAFLDVELKGEHDRAVVEVLAAGRGADLRYAVVSSFDTATQERIAGLAPAWPRWLNAETLDHGVVATATELRCRGVAVWFEALDAETVGLAQAAGLEVAAYTVRRRSTFDRLSRLGVSAVCVEAAALDG